ncbi:MAG: hypothetical protein ACLGRW_11060 [Acidobacteriota bacterium]
MTVVPTGEIVSAGTTLPDQGLPKPELNGANASGKVQRTDEFDTNQTSVRDSSAAGVSESFRTRWQALLAGLKDGAKGPYAEEASQAEMQRTADAYTWDGMRISSPAALYVGAGVLQSNRSDVPGPRATLGRSQGAGRLETALTARTSTSKSRSHHADALPKRYEAHPAEPAKLDVEGSGVLLMINQANTVSFVTATRTQADQVGSAARPAVDAIDVQRSRAFVKGFSGPRSILLEQRADSGNSVPAVKGLAVKGIDAPTASLAAGAEIAGDLPAGHGAPDAGGSEAKNVSTSDPVSLAMIPNLGSPSSPIQAVSAETIQASVSESQNPGQVRPQESSNAGSGVIRGVGNVGSASCPAALPAAAVSGLAGRAEAEKQSLPAVRKSELPAQILREDRRREESVAGPGTDASSVLARDPAAARGTIEIADGGSAGTSSTDGISARAAFSALDADTGMAARNWIHASGHHAEAGFQDPALGWIGVRAEMSGGNVHASLVPGSAAAAQVLGGQIEGLHSYLAEHHAPVANITLAAPEGHGAGRSAGQGANQGMHHGSGQQSGQDAPAQPHADARLEPAVLTNTPALAPARSDWTETVLARGRGGAYISVLA